jgi:septum site-determining protein MinC
VRSFTPEDPPSEPVPLEADEPAAPARTTLVIDKPLRSGQRVYAKGGDLVVLAVVSHGAEVIADGNIHIYAPLRGRALAGAMGDTGARIFATCMEPQLLSIAGIYRTTETELPASVLGKPGQVRLDGEKLVVLPLNID